MSWGLGRGERPGSVVRCTKSNGALERSDSRLSRREGKTSLCRTGAKATDVGTGGASGGQAGGDSTGGGGGGVQ
jgi:hypothetical protein